jgi:PKD repeat protein
LLALFTLLLLLSLTFPTALQAERASIDPLLFRELEQAPNGEADYIVFLKDTADLQAAPLISSRSERIHYVYQALRDTAERSQAGLRADLEAWGVPYHAFYIVNAIRVTGDAALAHRLVARPEVARIVADPAFNGLDDPPDSPSAPPAVNAVEWNIVRVHAPEVWALGYTGQGIVVGSVDTGVDYTHPALVNQYRGNLGGGNFDHNYNWTEPFDNSTEPYDSGSHGTHTTGTMVGDDGGANQVGMAPGAQWIACKVESGGVWHASKYIACWEWMIAPTDLNGQNPDPSKAAHVVNNSWSCPPEEGCDQDTLLAAAEALYAAGIAITKSAGNAGSGCGSITNPGQYRELLATGAFNSSDIIASFSSRGPVDYQGETRVKPDIAAPGVAVRSSTPGGNYSSSSGTSMAAPHTAGVIALLWSAQPALIGDLEATYQIVKATAEPKIDAQCPPFTDHPNNVWGWGIINALAAAQSGELRGTVYDDSFALLPGTTVEVAPTGGGTARQTIADANAAYTFTLQAGSYAITATLAGYLPSTGVVDVVSGTTTVYDIFLEPIPPCEPVTNTDFAWLPVTPTVGSVVTFTGYAEGSDPIVFEWAFGDGATAGPGPHIVTHTYDMTGSFTVIMTTTNCTDTYSMVTTHTLSVVEPPCEPVQDADFAWTPLTPTVGQVVAFTGTASGTEPIGYDWDFGDGSLGSGMTTTHVYTAAGSYDVHMLATNACGWQGISYTLAVVEPCVPVDILTVSMAISNCQVSFDAIHTGDAPFAFLWSFGDGVTSTAEMPIYDYGTSGTYSGTLEMWNCGDAGYDSELFVVTVDCIVTYEIYLPLISK